MDAGSFAGRIRWLEPVCGRLRPAAELIAVVGLLEAELWSLRAVGPAWLNVLIYGTILLILGLSARRRAQDGSAHRTSDVGVTRAWVEVAAACLALSTCLMVAARLVGDSNETFEFLFLDKPPRKLAGWLVGKFAAALGQQLALQFFLWPVCHELTRGRVSGAFLAATIFGMIHLPSPTLVAITTLAGLVWIGFYSRTGRLAPLVVSHMILATLAHGALPERLTYDMRVGLTATADKKRFEELNDPRIRLINRRLKENRANLRLYTSRTYYEAQGGDLPGFIRGVFRDILGRAASDADIAFWTGRKLANPQVDIANILLASDEYAQIVETRATRHADQSTRR